MTNEKPKLNIKSHNKKSCDLKYVMVQLRILSAIFFIIGIKSRAQ